jgi:uncharacterized membrane protein
MQNTSVTHLSIKGSIKMNNQQILSVAIGSLLALGVAANASAKTEKPKMEHCFGIAKAGMNDCGGKKSEHACAGQGTKDSDAHEFISLPVGTCAKIVNGSTTDDSDMKDMKGMKK